MNAPVLQQPCLRTRQAAAAVVSAAVLALPALTWAQPRFALDSTPTVLSREVLPTHADLRLVLDPDQPGFSGSVALRLRVTRAQAAIEVHAFGLQAESATLVRDAPPSRRRGDDRDDRGGARRSLRVEPDAARQTWRLVPTDGRPIAAGAWRLALAWRGDVQQAGEGLFKADHRVAGQPARLLATQLQAVHARKVTPLFDEPVFRSIWQLTVHTPSGWQVLSNMPLESSMPLASGVEHRFAPTPPMPGYLLAVAVGRFDVLQGTSGTTPLRIFTAPGKGPQAQYALQATERLLPYFTRYFGRAYALPKLDQLAVPGTRIGAMEDWGLISYAEPLLLFDPERSSEAARRRIFDLMAHEIAHQWFGNLVSASSWSEIWLNEAFATWMASKATEHFHPEWQTALRLRTELDRTMARDATPATRAIRAKPVSEASVFEVFDDITYDKGGAVLAMLEQWLGEAAFQRGLAAYMKERAFKPASAGDLWFHIGKSAGKPVAAVAASWTDQPGVPLLQVAARCVGGSTVVELRQSRFALDAGNVGNAGTAALPGGPWQVPVRLARGATSRTVLLATAQGRAVLPGCSAEPLLANAGGRGYYVVDHDAAGWAAATAAFAALSPADRVTLLADSFALAQAGRRPLAAHLDLLAALPQVGDASRPALFTLAAAHWQALDLAFDGSAAQAPLRAAGQALFAAELDRLGWAPHDTETSETQALRALLIRQLAALDHEPTVAAARQRLAAALKGDTVAVPRTIRAAVMRAAGQHAAAADFEVLLAALRATDSAAERTLLASALADGRDAERARRLLDEALSGRLPHDTSVSLPGRVAAQPALAPLAYEFVVANWTALAAMAGDGPFGPRHWLLPNAVQASSDAAVAERMVADQLRLNGAAGASTAQQVLAAVQARQRLRQREGDALGAALSGWTPR